MKNGADGYKPGRPHRPAQPAEKASGQPPEGEDGKGPSDYVDEDTPQYLKQYITQHPSSKMAWYLLGKEYESQGKAAQARYCYFRAEEIYEAFEKKAIQSHATDEVQNEGDQANRKLKRITAGLLLLLLLLLLPSSLDGDLFVQEKQGETEGAEAKAADLNSEGDKPEEEDEADRLPRVILQADEELGKSESGRENGRLPIRIYNQETVWGELGRAGPWTLWGEEARVIAGVRPSGTAGKYELEVYDPELCQCEPVESAAAHSQLLRWMKEREEMLVLQSAIVAYQSLYGKPPEEAADLTGDYPANLLSNMSKRMEAAFAEYRDKLFPSGNAPLTSGESGENDVEEGVSPQAPLEIIVDKSNHRLALVSGNTIIRNYPVGLGGDRTPEGEFYISEKVVDPKGKKNGEFGSRGMTLSDTLYAIHGTNQPSSIGEDRSLGCVRMLDEDVKELYGMVPMGTKVSIVSEGLPEQVVRGAVKMELPVGDNETNPGKVYEWLN